MPDSVIVIGLIAVAGFLLGGVYTTWKTAKMLALVLLAAALVAAGGAALWWFSL